RRRGWRDRSQRRGGAGQWREDRGDPADAGRRRSGRGADDDRQTAGRERRLKMAGPFVIFAGERAWKIASGAAVDEVRIDAEASANDVAGAVAAKLRERGYQGEGVMLALPSAWCLSAGVSLEGLS